MSEREVTASGRKPHPSMTKIVPGPNDASPVPTRNDFAEPQENTDPDRVNDAAYVYAQLKKRALAADAKWKRQIKKLALALLGVAATSIGGVTFKLVTQADLEKTNAEVKHINNRVTSVEENVSLLHDFVAGAVIRVASPKK